MYDNLNAYFISAMYCYTIIANLYMLDIKKLFQMLSFCYFMVQWNIDNHKT